MFTKSFRKVIIVVILLVMAINTFDAPKITSAQISTTPVGSVTYTITCSSFSATVTGSPFPYVALDVGIPDSPTAYKRYQPGWIPTQNGSASRTVNFPNQPIGTVIQLMVWGSNGGAGDVEPPGSWFATVACSTNASQSQLLPCMNAAPPTNLKPGWRASVAKSIYGQGRVRSGPSQNFPIIRVLNVGGEFDIIGNPTCGPSSLWWQIRLPDGATGWMMEGFMEANGPDYYIEPVAAQTIPQTPSCPIHLITVDSGLSEGVVEGKVLGEDPCDATIEIHNTRSYWVNLKVIPLGGSKATAAGEDANLYAKFGILGPDAKVHYTVSFPKPGRSIQVQVDATFGTPAKIMNFTQFLIDGISLEAPESGISKGFSIVTEYYPKLQDLYSRTPNLRDAMNAFFDNDFGRFKADIQKAAAKQEFKTFGSALEDLGLAGAKEGLTKIFKEAMRSIEIAEILWRNGRSLLAFFSGGSTAGSVMFVAR